MPIAPENNPHPPTPAASPVEGEWLHEPDVPFWRPSGWSAFYYSRAWIWSLIPLALMGLGFIFVRFGWGIVILGVAWFKVLIFLVAIPISLIARSMRKSVQSRQDPFCIHCGYGLTGLPDNYRCPECGRPYTFRLINEYRRDPDWFIARCRAHRVLPGSDQPFAAGPVRSKRSKDGT